MSSNLFKIATTNKQKQKDVDDLKSKRLSTSISTSSKTQGPDRVRSVSMTPKPTAKTTELIVSNHSPKQYASVRECE